MNWQSNNTTTKNYSQTASIITLKPTICQSHINHQQLGKSLHKISALLIDNNDWQSIANEILEEIGTTLKFDRVYISKYQQDKQGNTELNRIFEWCKPNINTIAEHKSWQKLNNARNIYQSWRTKLANQKIYCGDIKQFTQEEQALYSELNIKSLGLFPIHHDNMWWGTLGIEQCNSIQKWTLTEIRALKKLSVLLESVIDKAHNNEKKQSVNLRNRYETISIAKNEVLYERHANGDFIWCSNNSRDILGYSFNTIKQAAAWWLINIHPEERKYVKQSLARSIQKKENTWEMEYWFQDSDGRYVKVLDQAHISFSDNKPIITGAIKKLDIPPRLSAANEDI